MILILLIIILISCRNVLVSAGKNEQEGGEEKEKGNDAFVEIILKFMAMVTSTPPNWLTAISMTSWLTAVKLMSTRQPVTNTVNCS